MVRSPCGHENRAAAKFCEQCGAPLAVAPQRATAGRFDRDKFLVNQKWLTRDYYVYDEENRELFYADWPFRFFGRRNITVFEDDSKQAPVLLINQELLWEFLHRRYTVQDAKGEVIAKLSRNNLTSLFRRRWDILDPAGTVIAKAREDTVALTFVRRLVNFIPFVDLLGGIIKTDFHFFRFDAAGNEQKIGSFDRRIGFFDKYVLDLTDDSERTLDRRVALAVAILLDMAEKR